MIQKLNHTVYNKFKIFNQVKSSIKLPKLKNQLFPNRRRQVRLGLSNAPGRARRKRRRNAIISIGHFISWLAEVSIFGLIGVAMVAIGGGEKLSPGHSIFIVLIPSINYVLIPLVQTVSSPDLRANVCCCWSNTKMGLGRGARRIDVL